MIPTAALRQALQPAPIDPDSAAYRQGIADTVEGLLWMLEARISEPISKQARLELQRLAEVLTTRPLPS